MRSGVGTMTHSPKKEAEGAETTWRGMASTNKSRLWQSNDLRTGDTVPELLV
jgi:hypothetical protein